MSGEPNAATRAALVAACLAERWLSDRGGVIRAVTINASGQVQIHIDEPSPEARLQMEIGPKATYTNAVIGLERCEAMLFGTTVTWLDAFAVSPCVGARMRDDAGRMCMHQSPEHRDE